MDLTRGIGGKNAVLGKRRIANHPIQSDFTPGGSGHTELSSRQRLTGGAVPLLDNQRALGLIFEG